MSTVLLNATAIGPRPDGISTYAVQLLQGLAAIDTDVRFRVLFNEAARERLRAVPLPAGAEIVWAGAAVSPHRGSRGHLMRRLHAEWSAWRHRGGLVAALSPLEAPFSGAPSVVTVHDLTPLHLPDHHPRQRHFYRTVLPPALRRASRLIVPSSSTREALVARYGLDARRIRVIPHGSPVPLRAPDAPLQPGRHIVCIGRPDPVKNLETLLRAFISVHDRVPGNLVLAGVGVQASQWSTLPLAPLNGRVRFVPDLSDEDKVRLIDDAALLVDASMDEGFGFPALEAMSRGCPVAAARTGALPEVCGDAAEYFEPRDVDGLAALLARVLPDAGRRAELSARGRRRAESFSWERSARAHLDVFEEALRETARP
jgi:glycosyltransferase involved in cell wall biosynthesis